MLRCVLLLFINILKFIFYLEDTSPSVTQNGFLYRFSVPHPIYIQYCIDCVNWFVWIDHEKRWKKNRFVLYCLFFLVVPFIFFSPRQLIILMNWRLFKIFWLLLFGHCLCLHCNVIANTLCIIYELVKEILISVAIYILYGFVMFIKLVCGFGTGCKQTWSLCDLINIVIICRLWYRKVAESSVFNFYNAKCYDLAYMEC